MTARNTVARGLRFFNRGRYLSAQEVWEEAWRAAPAEERGFLEGLVQLAAGLHLRTRRGATRGAVHLLALALVTLEDYRPAAHGIDVEAWSPSSAPTSTGSRPSTVPTACSTAFASRGCVDMSGP